MNDSKFFYVLLVIDIEAFVHKMAEGNVPHPGGMLIAKIGKAEMPGRWNADGHRKLLYTKYWAMAVSYLSEISHRRYPS
ncbi:hypothetical protein ACQZ46_23385 [Agrobacterium salinitolerans]